MQSRRIERILVATDGSADSIEAAAFAARLAPGLVARVTVLHVSPPADLPLGTTQLGGDLPQPGPEDSVELVKAVWEGSQRILDASVTQLERAGVAAEGLVLDGDAAEEILGLLEQVTFDLIVLGRRGTGGTDSDLGGTATAVVRAARCPVLVVGSSQGK